MNEDNVLLKYDSGQPGRCVSEEPAASATLMEAIGSSDKSLRIYQAIRRHILARICSEFETVTRKE